MWGILKNKMLALVGILPLKMPGLFSSNFFMCLSGIVGKLKKKSLTMLCIMYGELLDDGKRKKEKKGGPSSQGVCLFWEWPSVLVVHIKKTEVLVFTMVPM
jgi:hypothetical protein